MTDLPDAEAARLRRHLRTHRLRVWRVTAEQWRHLVALTELSPATHRLTRLDHEPAVECGPHLFLQET